MTKLRAASPLRDLYRYDACMAPTVAERIYTSVNSDLSNSLASAMQSGRFLEIVSASINPMDYSSADTFGRDYLCAELMSKYPEWDLGINKQELALDKFREAEELCRITNSTFLQSIGCSTIGIPAHSLILSARRKISRLLGDFSWPEVFRAASWGPGATTRLSRVYRDSYYKFKGIPHVTHDLFPIARKMVGSIPGWNVPYLECVLGNKVTTVPKNAKIDRVIAIEPDLNMVVQKGIGKMIRRRLQRVGLLLWDAQERNAAYAQLGSRLGDLATIDLSMASDTVSYELVRSLLPPRWLGALEQSRSPSGVLPDGTRVEYHKFSSMGNGYTFELETLIFWALVQAVLDLYPEKDHRMLVFGDDVVVPVHAMDHVLDVFRMCGFVPNMKKTFSAGPFRESCGKHYFQGSDVTPFYVRRPVDNITRRFWLANSIKRWSKLHYGLDPLLLPVYRHVVDSIPKRWHLPIPDGYGDGGLVMDFDEATPNRARKGLEGYRYRAVSQVTPGRVYDDASFLLKGLYSLELGGVESESTLEVPENRQKFRITDSVAPQWSHLGPWLI